MSVKLNSLAMKQIGRLFRDGTSVGLGDGDLLARFVARRDEAAFEALVSRHGPMVLGVCRRMLNDPHDADDAFQATFLVLVRKAPGIRDADRLAPWLYGVAHRVAGRARIRAIRRAANEKVGTDIEPSVRPAFNDLTDVRSIIDAEVARLSAKYREVLVLCLLEGLTAEQAAARLHCPPGTVRSRLARGRETLKGRLSARGLAPALAASAVLGSSEIVRACSVPERLLTPLLQAAADPLNPLAGIGTGAATLTREAMQPMFYKTLKYSAMLAAGMGVSGLGLVESVRSTAEARQTPFASPMAHSAKTSGSSSSRPPAGNPFVRNSNGKGFGMPGARPGGMPFMGGGFGMPGFGVPPGGFPPFGMPGGNMGGFPGFGAPGSNKDRVPDANKDGAPGFGMPGGGFPGFGATGAKQDGFPGFGLAGGNMGGFPGFGAPDANKDRTPDANKEGAPGFGMPGGNFGGMPFMNGMGMPGQSGASSNVEQRLNELERKLDQLLEKSGSDKNANEEAK
jgi:RNA polymerase sigma factor (sigma-70 family)